MYYPVASESKPKGRLHITVILAAFVFRRAGASDHGNTSNAGLSLNAVVGQSIPSSVLLQRLDGIERSLESTFNAFPKNGLNRLPQQAARYLLQRYLADSDGWYLTGLEPYETWQTTMKALHEISIIQHKALALKRALLDIRPLERGVSLQEAAMLAVALKHLLLKEAVNVLELAYSFNNRSKTEQLEWNVLQKVLLSFAIIYKRGNADSKMTVKRVESLLPLYRTETVPDVLQFVQSSMRRVAGRVQLAAGSRASQYSFRVAARMVRDMTKRYGKWQHEDCRAMKEDLVGLYIDGSCRVLLRTFHGRKTTSKYDFSESRTALPKIGALDESDPGKPRVIITDYVDGPSSCVAPFKHHSICCLSACTTIMAEFETKLQAPTAPLERLLAVVNNLTSASIEFPRQLPHHLVEKLHCIAVRYGGMIPIYGRLFAKWIHHAFPHKCPYPSRVGTSNVWLDPTITLTKNQRRYAQQADFEERMPDSLLQWSDEEVLPFVEGLALTGEISDTGFWKSARIVVHVIMLLAMLRAAVALSRNARISINNAFAQNQPWNDSPGSDERRSLDRQRREDAAITSTKGRQHQKDRSGNAKGGKKMKEIKSSKSPAPSDKSVAVQALATEQLPLVAERVESLETYEPGVTFDTMQDSSDVGTKVPEGTKLVEIGSFVRETSLPVPMVYSDLLNHEHTSLPASRAPNLQSRYDTAEDLQTSHLPGGLHLPWGSEEHAPVGPSVAMERLRDGHD